MKMSARECLWGGRRFLEGGGNIFALFYHPGGREEIMAHAETWDFVRSL